MSTQTRWIPLDGAVNVRDLGGLPTIAGGTTRFGRVLRSDNLQALSPADLATLTGELALTDVIDLRSNAEDQLEGPGPLTRVPGVTVHRLSLFTEGGAHTDVAADLDLDKVLPWAERNDQALPEHTRSVSHYLGYLAERPDSVVQALRVMATARGAAIAHCAAGKDRTGVVCAFALEAVGVTREAVVADYAQTAERLDLIMARMRASTTYAADLDTRPADSHRPEPYVMEKFLATIDERHGGPLGWLTAHGWTSADQAALMGRLG
jgi:protein tyrosine/serine phosphatase